MGAKVLRKIMLGKETTAGTNVAATIVWRGMGTLEDKRKFEFVDENVGLAVPTDRSHVAGLEAEIALEDTPATFEQLPVLLSAAVENVVTGSTDTGGSGKIWQYDFPTTSMSTVRSWSVECVTAEETEEVSYAFCPSFNLKGAGNQAVMVSGVLTGRTASTTTATVVAIADVEDVLFNNGKLYVDATNASFGTTLKSSTLLGFDLNVETGIVPRFTADGQLYFSGIKYSGPKATLELTFEHGANSIAERNNWRSQTARKIRLLFEGTTLTTAGATYSKKSLIIDLVGKWSKFDKIGEQDGNDVISATFEMKYNSTAAATGKIIVVNQTASI